MKALALALLLCMPAHAGKKAKKEDMAIAEPPEVMTFTMGDSNKPVGRLTWESGRLSFEGNADQSALVFLAYVIERSEAWKDDQYSALLSSYTKMMAEPRTAPFFKDQWEKCQKAYEKELRRKP